MKTIGMVECNLTGADAISALKSNGFKVVLFTSSLNRLKSILPVDAVAKFSQLDQVIEVSDSSNFDCLLKSVTEFSKLFGLDLLYTFAQPRVVVTSLVARTLGLPGCSPQAIEVASDKHLLRERLNALGISPVRSLSVDKVQNLREAILDIGLPCIVKPRSGHSSIGVNLIRNRRDLEQFLVNKSLTGRDGVSDALVVEEFLDGPLFSLEMITCRAGDHLLWGASDRSILDHSIEIGASFPVEFPRLQEAVAMVSRALDAIGCDLGPTHTEIIVTSKGPRIVEINPRAGGSGISRLIERATGKQVSIEIVNAHFGNFSREHISVKGVYSMRSVLGAHTGRVQRLPSSSSILSIEGVVDVWFQNTVGEEYQRDSSNFASLLTILAGPTKDKTSKAIVDSAAKKIEKEIFISPALEMT